MKPNKSKLDIEFKEAYRKASTTDLRFPPDVRLHFYAYYKRATDENFIHQEKDLDTRLIIAFKMNAMFQIQGLSKEDAKRKYIELVNKYITE